MIAFLAIILSYFSTTTFCSHIHIIDGEVIIHSHIFIDDDNNSDNNQPATHNHTNKEIQLIQTLSVFHSTDSITPCIEIGLPYRNTHYIEIPQETIAAKTYYREGYYLRPPPSYFL